LLCGARNRRSGGWCCRPAMRNGRCYQHGGATHFRTRRLRWQPGLAAANAAHRVWLAERHRLGLKHPGGRPKGRWAWKTTDAKEILMRKIEDALENLPATPNKPIKEMKLPELLNENVRQGLIRSHEILAQPLKLKASEDDELTAMDIRLQRVVAETAAGQARLLAHIQVAAMRTDNNDKDWGEIRQRINEEEEKIWKIREDRKKIP
jgi:hypothetical protein